jgi:hypothetical protein
MNHISFRGSIYLIIAVLIMMIQPSDLQAQTQEKASAEKIGGLPPSGTGVEKQFHDAREKFLKKEYQNAAAEIRRGAAFLDEEAKLATDDRKKALIASARELDQLADRERKGAVHSVQELERAFARAEHALARYYHSKALESWYGKAVPDAGRHLKAAAVHLENALDWAGHRLEAGGMQAIQEGKRIGEKMEKGAGWGDSEVRKAIEDMKKEIDEGGHKIGLLK